MKNYEEAIASEYFRGGMRDAAPELTSAYIRRTSRALGQRQPFPVSRLGSSANSSICVSRRISGDACSWLYTEKIRKRWCWRGDIEVLLNRYVNYKCDRHFRYARTVVTRARDRRAATRTGSSCRGRRAYRPRYRPTIIAASRTGNPPRKCGARVTSSPSSPGPVIRAVSSTPPILSAPVLPPSERQRPELALLAQVKDLGEIQVFSFLHDSPDKKHGDPRGK